MCSCGARVVFNAAAASGEARHGAARQRHATVRYAALRLTGRLRGGECRAEEGAPLVFPSPSSGSAAGPGGLACEGDSCCCWPAAVSRRCRAAPPGALWRPWRRGRASRVWVLGGSGASRWECTRSSARERGGFGGMRRLGVWVKDGKGHAPRPVALLLLHSAPSEGFSSVSALCFRALRSFVSDSAVTTSFMWVF